MNSYNEIVNSNYILSICIPTYNRSESLFYSLRSIIDATSNFQEIVEIVVSNNCSTDRTNEVLEGFTSIPNFRYFTNQCNLGFNLNYFKLIDEYSRGKYCWIIGDDDFIKPDSVQKVLQVLSLFPETDFIFANYETRTYQSIVSNFDNSFLSQSKIDIIDIDENGLCRFDELLNKNPRFTNILMTYISVSIFKRKLLKEYNKDIFSNKSWESFGDLFPHSYMFASIMKNRKAYYFDKPILIAAVQDKEWDHQLPALYLKYIPELFQYYKLKGYSKNDLSKTNEIIIIAGVINFLRRFKPDRYSLQVRWFFIKNYLFKRIFYFTLLKFIYKSIMKLFNKII